jgi:hypothetical protein
MIVESDEDSEKSSVKGYTVEFKKVLKMVGSVNPVDVVNIVVQSNKLYVVVINRTPDNIVEVLRDVYEFYKSLKYRVTSTRYLTIYNQLGDENDKERFVR